MKQKQILREYKTEGKEIMTYQRQKTESQLAAISPGNLGQEEKGETEDEMVGQHQRLNVHEFEQTPGDSEGQGSLTCCSPWGHKESDMTEQLNNNRYLQECG